MSIGTISSGGLERHLLHGFYNQAGFLGIMLFGWKRVSPGMHLFSTCMVAFGASLSAFWIMVANSWMQTPAGGSWVNGRYIIENYWQGIFNPDLPWGFSHMWVACIETTLFVVGGISALYILRKRYTDFFLKSFKLALVAAILITPLQIWLGDGAARAVARHQPAKLGATGSIWAWLTPYTLFLSVGLACGYVLLGAAYLIIKTEGDMQASCRNLALVFALLSLFLAAGAIVWAWRLAPPLVEKWATWPAFWLTAFPAILGFLAFFGVLISLRTSSESAPLVLAGLFFVFTFLSLAGSVHPYILPPNLTIEAAASPPITLRMMLYVLIPLLPIMFLYNIYQFMVFRGKTSEAGYGEE